jgi:hypothetical protein
MKSKMELFRTARMKSEKFGYVSIVGVDLVARKVTVRTMGGVLLAMSLEELTDFCL